MKLLLESKKALVAILITALSTFLSSTGEGLTTGEGLRSAALSLLAGLLVWLTKNKEKEKPDVVEGALPRANPFRDEVGRGVVGLLVLVVGVICLLVGGIDLLAGLLENRPVALVRDIVLIVVGTVLVAVSRKDVGPLDRPSSRF